MVLISLKVRILLLSEAQTALAEATSRKIAKRSLMFSVGMVIRKRPRSPVHRLLNIQGQNLLSTNFDLRNITDSPNGTVTQIGIRKKINNYILRSCVDEGVSAMSVSSVPLY